MTFATELYKCSSVHFRFILNVHHNNTQQNANLKHNSWYVLDFIKTTTGPASNDKVGIMTTPGFQLTCPDPWYSLSYVRRFLVPCFVAVDFSALCGFMPSVTNILLGCFTGTGTTTWLPSVVEVTTLVDIMGDISLCLTIIKYNKARTVCIFHWDALQLENLPSWC